MRHYFGAEHLLMLPLSPLLRREFSFETAAPVPSSTAFTGPSADVTKPINPQLIHKPSGEVTRLSREGYNLRDALGWTEAVYSDVQVRLLLNDRSSDITLNDLQTAIHKLADSHLKPVSFSKQSTADLQKVYDLVIALD